MNALRQKGQALILVLIILAVGSLTIIPALRLTSTSLKNSAIVTDQIQALYSADAAQEYVLWKLVYGNLGSQFYADGQSANFTFDACGTPVEILVVMRATAGEGGTTLATDDIIRPTKTVEPDVVPNGNYRIYTYTINVEQVSSNTSSPLDAIYDILPVGFRPNKCNYITGSSKWRENVSANWTTIDDPAQEDFSNFFRLKWPASYDPDTKTGGFSSPMNDFDPGQVKQLQFQLGAQVNSGAVYCNNLIIKAGNITSLGSRLAPVYVNTTDDYCSQHGLLEVTKTSEPQIIQPGVVTDILYTVNITNREDNTLHIKEITDFLPPGFIYCGPGGNPGYDDCDPPSGITDLDPLMNLEYLNGLFRWRLTWTPDEMGGQPSIAAGESLYLSFWARTTKDVSGSYYNEVTAKPDEANPPAGFNDIIPPEDWDKWSETYSWNTGIVIVPGYDSSTTADPVTIDANLSLILGGISIHSWQIR